MVTAKLMGRFGGFEAWNLLSKHSFLRDVLRGHLCHNPGVCPTPGGDIIKWSLSPQRAVPHTQLPASLLFACWFSSSHHQGRVVAHRRRCFSHPAHSYKWFPVREARAEAASLHPQWVSVFGRAVWSPRALPASRSLVCAEGSGCLEPDKELNQVFHSFCACWLT